MTLLNRYYLLNLIKGNRYYSDKTSRQEEEDYSYLLTKPVGKDTVTSPLPIKKTKIIVPIYVAITNDMNKDMPIQLLLIKEYKKMLTDIIHTIIANNPSNKLDININIIRSLGKTIMAVPLETKNELDRINKAMSTVEELCKKYNEKNKIYGSATIATEAANFIQLLVKHSRSLYIADNKNPPVSLEHIVNVTKKITALIEGHPDITYNFTHLKLSVGNDDKFDIKGHFINCTYQQIMDKRNDLKKIKSKKNLHLQNSEALNNGRI